jgi:uncharacterized membrane protein YfcA
LGPFLGAWTLTLITPDFIRKLLPFILALLLFFTLKNKNFGLNEYRPNENTRCLVTHLLVVWQLVFMMVFLAQELAPFLCFYL